MTGACLDDPLTLRIPETTIGAVCGKSQARNLRGDTQELGYTRSQVISRSPKPLPFSNIPPDHRNSLSCPVTQQTFPLKTSSSSGTKRWRQGKRSRPGWWPSCPNTRTDCRRITSSCEPGWRPAHPLHPSRPDKGKEVVVPDDIDLQADDELSSDSSPLPRRSPSPNAAEAQSRKRPPRRPNRSISTAQRRVRREATKDRRQSKLAHEYALERPGGVAPPGPSMHPPFGVATAPHMFFSSTL